MIKAWPQSTREAAFAILSRLWANKSIPTWWGDELLCGIPKKADSSTLANVRPIGLLEVLRKLWTSLIVVRIQDVREKHNVLQPRADIGGGDPHPLPFSSSLKPSKPLVTIPTLTRCLPHSGITKLHLTQFLVTS
jgi:hypothetical protein